MMAALSPRQTKDAASRLHEHIPYFGQPGVLRRPAVHFDRHNASRFPCLDGDHWILVWFPPRSLTWQQRFNHNNSLINFFEGTSPFRVPCVPDRLDPGPGTPERRSAVITVRHGGRGSYLTGMRLSLSTRSVPTYSMHLPARSEFRRSTHLVFSCFSLSSPCHEIDNQYLSPDFPFPVRHATPFCWHFCG